MSYKDRFFFNYQIPTKIIFGEGAIKEVKKEMDSLGINQALVVTDGTLQESPMVKSLSAVLEEREAGLFAGVVPDSSLAVVVRGAETFRAVRADGLISIGGGSSMDTAKAIAVLIKKGQNDLRDFIGHGKIGEPVTPHIAIPTTSGTGSEVTMFATIKDPAAKVKNLLSDPFLIPPVAILDPQLTAGLPPAMTASTGMDALSHAIESLHARGYEPITDGLALQAIRLTIRYLPRCLEKGEDLEARGMQAIASTIAGMALQNAQVGCVHGMAHALGGMYGLHHGLANAILLPHGMRFNMPICAPRYRQLTEIFGIDPRGKSDLEIGEMIVQAIESFTKRLGLPPRLSEVGIPKENLEEVAKIACADPAMRLNIRKVKEPLEILSVLQQAW